MEIKSIPQIINEVQELLDENDYESAYNVAKENLDLNKKHEEGEYIFKNLLEELLFQVLIKGDIKKKIPLILDYSSLYSNYGEILLHLDNKEDAKKSFELSYEYNPINIKANFGLAEIAKEDNDLDKFYKLAIESFKIAYHPNDLAKSFRNLSYYFLKIAEEELNINHNTKEKINPNQNTKDKLNINHNTKEKINPNQNTKDKLNSLESIKENLKIGICLREIGKSYDNSSKLAREESIEIDYLISKFDNELVKSDENDIGWDEKDLEKCKEFIMPKGLPYEAGIEVITICKNLGFQLDEAKKVVPALYYFNIAYELTKDKDIKLVIDDLNEKIERRANE